MSKNNKINTYFFESHSMKSLFDKIHLWQKDNKIRLLSLSIEKDQDSFCCIALSNPTEVSIKKFKVPSIEIGSRTLKLVRTKEEVGWNGALPFVPLTPKSGFWDSERMIGQDAEKRCTECYEMVKERAKICKHCHFKFSS